MTQSRAPLIVAIVLLLLPVLYVGSYLALVVPEGILLMQPGTVEGKVHYREANGWAGKAFLPLEQIDRALRPRAWADGSERIWETRP